MVAALCTWHEHHARAAQEIVRRLDDGEMLAVSAPALIETYAVLTRLPPPHRLSPSDSLALLASELHGQRRGGRRPRGNRLSASAGHRPERGIAGGAIYDAVIPACAQVGRVDNILTFNERQFRQLGLQVIEIVVPS